MSEKNRIRIKNSVVIVVGQASGEEIVSQLVRSFDVADKTPLDCFEFVRKLKELLKK